MKKIIFSLLLLLGLGFNSLFGATQSTYPYILTSNGGDRAWGQWDNFSQLTYNPLSGRYITDEAHAGVGYLYIKVLGSGYITAPRVGIGASDLHLDHVVECTHSGYSVCKYYGYVNYGDTNGALNIHTTDGSGVYNMAVHVRTP